MANTNEDEFFAKQSAELVGKAREKQLEEARKAERASHRMKCPKCGGDLVEEDYKGVLIDRCPDCNGLWFDAGEVEKMSEVEEHGFVTGMFKSVFRIGGSSS